MRKNNDYVNKQVKADQSKDAPFIFVSYSHKDFDRVQELLVEMDRNHFRFWYDEGLHSGKEWTDEIGWRIANCTQFVCILSQNAVDSDNVQNEIHMATVYHRPLCVIYLEPTKLSLGLELQIGRIQAVHAYREEKEYFFKKVMEGLDLKATKSMDSTVTLAKSELLKKYEIHEMLGRGGMGNVYRATQRNTGIDVAVKHVVFDGSHSSNFMKNLFWDEQRILIRLNECPFVPKVMDWFEDSENIYLVQTFLGGDTLRKFEEEFDEKQVVDIGRKALHILRYLEKYGVVHKDIKPHNMKLDDMGTVTLLDFGTSRIMDGGSKGNEPRMGTHGYAAPEQFAVEDTEVYSDFSTDIYGLGRTLIYLLVKNRMSSAMFVGSDCKPLRYYRYDISPMLERILYKMTMRDRTLRYQNADEVLAALDGYEDIPDGEREELYEKSNQAVQGYQYHMMSLAEEERPEKKLQGLDEVLERFDTAVPVEVDIRLFAEDTWIPEE